MSDVSHSSNHATIVEENTDPLPIPPRSATSDAPVDPIREAIARPTFYQVRDEDFPHPDEPGSDKLNDSDQENVPPTTVPPTACAGSPVRAQVLRRTQMSVPFSSDDSVNVTERSRNTYYTDMTNVSK